MCRALAQAHTFAQKMESARRRFDLDREPCDTESDKPGPRYQCQVEWPITKRWRPQRTVGTTAQWSAIESPYLSQKRLTPTRAYQESLNRSNQQISLIYAKPKGGQRLTFKSTLDQALYL